MMKLAFLCPQQRHHLQLRPASAKTVWERWYAHANDALPLTGASAVVIPGNAFEAADIYLQHAHDSRASVLVRYVDTAIHLISRLMELKQPRLGIAVASISALTLQQSGETGGDRRAVRIGLRRLKAITTQLLEQLPSGVEPHATSNAP